ncbi:MAG: invasion associated locus B family protein [Acidiphilium sp.]|nr:invasion associated locus B family protein [Acidiphilium sp.]MDD4936134.1 invasion associated locus B family protein [Acidiphilium sp.]
MKHAPLLVLLAVAAPCLAFAAQTPATDAPKPLGVFKSWTAATYGTGPDKACYAFTTSKVAKGSKATPAMLTVTERASFRDEISLSQGITYTKDAKVTLVVGGNTLKFFTKDNMAYAMKGAATTQAFLGGSSVIATAAAPNAKPVTDSFGLDGFSDAYKAIKKACPSAAALKKS